jgi:UDP-N-acetylmuramoylalanine--D-glutamate ligase
MEFYGKRILIIGLGKSGISACRWLVKEGADVTIGDIQPEKALNVELLGEAQKLGAKLEIGEHRKETFIRSDMIIVSPGVPLDIAPLEAAREKRIPIIGEMELASRLFDTPILAVTGTNGKTTSVGLLESMLRRAGAKLFVGGNIGTPVMDYVLGERDADYVILEVSSFQLDTMEQFRPELALLLNISPDHLDRYTDYGAYVQSKLKIFRNQGPGHFAVLNDDDAELSAFNPQGGMSVLRYGMKRKVHRNAYLEDRAIMARLPGEEKQYFDIEKFQLPGRHNLENLMGTLLAGLALGVRQEVIQESINSFQGLPHRLELVGRKKGIEFYDDSKATNVDSAIRSIESFDRSIILIAGGRHKGADYTPLVRAAKGRVKCAIFLGEAKNLMAASFKDIIPFELVDNMDDAVSRAYLKAKADNVVLLAPACSSFDMYTDYSHRGRVFKQKVKSLKNGN